MTHAYRTVATATPLQHRQSPSLFLPAPVSLKETAYTEVEMQHHHHEAAPGTASKTIYTTSGAADSHDDDVEENGGDAYSSVREPEQAPTYSTVGHPAGPPAAAAAAQDPDSNSSPLYHTVGQH